MENIFIFFNDKSNNSLFLREYEISFSKKERNFEVIKTKKVVLNEDPFVYIKGDSWVVGTGTLSYKSLGVKEGFRKLATDILDGKFIHDELYGCYSIIVFCNNKLSIYFDEAGIGSLYLGDGVISSRFLCCCDMAKSLSINTNAVFEQIYTGCFLNGKSTFSGINRQINDRSTQINNVDVQFIVVKHKVEDPHLKNREEALEYQLAIFDSYFKRWEKQLASLKIDIGLSSGFDSRLMLALIYKYFAGNFQVHSNWKAVEDFDNKIGKILAQSVGLELKRVPITDRNKISTEDFERILEDACYYYDGVFPTNHGWVRAYRSVEHRTEVLGDSKFGLTGLSGEEYRNDLKFLPKPYKIDVAIEEILFDGLNYVAYNKYVKFPSGMSELRRSVGEMLSIGSEIDKVSREEMQRMYCEMWVACGPGLRNRYENQISYFTSPFAERSLQKKSYYLIPFLGTGGSFQADLIKRLNPALAKTMSNYGYSFDRIPLKFQIIDILTAFIGRTKRSLSYSIRKTPYSDNFGPHKNYIEERFKYIEKYKLPFILNSDYYESESTNDRIVALSFLLKKYENKIKA